MFGSGVLRRIFALRILSAFVVVILLAACGDSTAVATASTPKSAALSGSVVVESYSSVDRDVEERYNESLQLENNDSDDAQLISNPVKLGGYLSGTEGNYSDRKSGQLLPSQDFFKDPVDYFQVQLVKDQTVALSVFYTDTQDYYDAATIDVTLNLLDPNDPAIVLASMSFDNEGTDLLEVPATRDYLIELRAEESDPASVPVLYTLTISQSLSQAERMQPENARLALEADFVPGEILIRYKDGHAPDEHHSLARTWQARGELHLLRALGDIARVYRMDDKALARGLSFTDQSGLTERQEKKWQTLQKIAELREDGSIAYAEPNYLMKTTAIDDAEYAQQWNMSMLELPAAWQVASGEGVKVAVIDTGIHSDHVDLLNNISADGYDFVSVQDVDGDGVPGRDGNPFDPGTTYHGSHVAGIIAASANTVGIRGVAYNAEIVPLRALGFDGVGSIADIADAVLYAAGLQSAGGRRLSSPVDVINLSLGSYDNSATLRSAIAQAISAGSIVVAAAGNDARSQNFYPAAYADVVGVSSIDERKSRSGFSNLGGYVDVTAPGGTYYTADYYDGFQDGILSTVYANEYSELTGTSMAAPHVSGVVALMKQIDPEMTLNDLNSLLESGQITDRIEQDGVSESTQAAYFGAGLINASKAVNAAGGEIPDTLIVSPSELGFIDGTRDGQFSLSNPGNGGVEVLSITPSKDWLSISPSSPDDFVNGLGTYAVEANLALAQNIDSAQIEVEYRIDAGVSQFESIPVFLSKALLTEKTVGNLTVYLVRWEDIERAENNGELKIDVYDAVSGDYNNLTKTYDFSFSNVPNGLYALEASTDNDGDGLLFDLGEARGAYPLLSESQLIRVRGKTLSDLDFEAGYQSFLNSSSAQDNSSRPLEKRAPASLP